MSDFFRHNGTISVNGHGNFEVYWDNILGLPGGTCGPGVDNGGRSEGFDRVCLGRDDRRFEDSVVGAYLLVHEMAHLWARRQLVP